MIDPKKKYTIKELFNKGVINLTALRRVEIVDTFQQEIQSASSTKVALIVTAEKHCVCRSTVEKIIYANKR